MRARALNLAALLGVALACDDEPDPSESKLCRDSCPSIGIYRCGGDGVHADVCALAETQCLVWSSGDQYCPELCVGEPLRIGLGELSELEVARDRCQFPSPEALELCITTGDVGVSSLPRTPSYNWTIQVILNRVGVDVAIAANFGTTPDILTSAGFVGGFTGYSQAVVDQKLLDIFAELANYFALVELGYDNGALTNEIIGNIVSVHDGVQGGPAPQLSYPAASMPPDVCERAGQIFVQMAAAITYHEFGHIWSWGCVDQREPGAASLLYYYPAKIEDDADVVSGALMSKAGFNIELGVLAFDLMTFQALHRKYGIYDFAQVESSYQTQFVATTPTYSSLATRKANMRAAYGLYAEFGGAANPEVPPVTCLEL